jgi:WD40 repeat protein
VQSLNYDDLQGLINEARRQGFYIGPDQTIAIAKVIVQFEALREADVEPQHLRIALGSIISKNAGEQQQFYRIFDTWHTARAARLARRAGRRKFRVRPETDQDIKQSRPLPFAIGAAAVVALVFAFSVVYSTSCLQLAGIPFGAACQVEPVTPGPTPDPGPEPDPGLEPEPEPGPQPEPDPGTDPKPDIDKGPETDPGPRPDPRPDPEPTPEVEPEPEVDPAPQPEVDPVPVPDPGPEIEPRPETEPGVEPDPEVEPGPDPSANLQQLTEPNIVTALAPRATGMWDTYSIYFDAFRNAAASTPLIAFLFWLAWRFRSRQAWLERRRERDPPDLFNMRISRDENDLFSGQNYTRALQLLRRHHRVPTRNLNVEQTVRSTARRPGDFSPVYDSRQISPEYLVLADRSTLSDHQAHLIRELVRQSKSEQLYIDLYYFDGDPRICYSERGRLDSITLEELTARHGDQRLLIAADGAALFDPLRGLPRAWTEMFSTWRERALIVPQTGDQWGAQQIALHSAGFGVIPFNEHGLRSLAEAFEEAGTATGEFIPPFMRPSVPPGREYPSVLLHDEDIWIDPDEDIEPEQIEELTQQLRTYLGDDGYDLLTACSAFPQPHWDITLYLDRVLRPHDEPGVREQRLLRLAQLPWFRNGEMPDDVRLQFLADLSTDREGQVRSAIHELLTSALVAAPGDGTIEIAHRHGRDVKRFIKDFFQFDKGAREAGEYDHIFIRFVMGGRPGPLDIELPKILQRLLPWKGWESFGARASLRGAASVVAFAVIAGTFSLFEGTLRGVTVLDPAHQASMSADIDFARPEGSGELVILPSLDFSPTDNNQFVAVSSDGTLVLGEVDDDEGIDRNIIDGLRAGSASFVAGGRDIFVQTTDGVSALYRASDLLTGHVEPLHIFVDADSQALSAGRTHVLSVTGDTVSYTELGQTKQIETAFAHGEDVALLAMDHQGTTITAVSQNYLSIFNIAALDHKRWSFSDAHHQHMDGAEARQLWHASQTTIVIYYSNGHTMVVENQNTTIVTHPEQSTLPTDLAQTLWGLPNEDAGADRRFPVQFNRADDHLVAMGHRVDDASEDDATVTMHALHGHSAEILSAQVDRIGHHAITTSADNTVRVWNIIESDEVAILRGHSEDVGLSALMPDNQHLLSLSERGTLNYWDLSSVLDLTPVPATHTDDAIRIAVTGPLSGEGSERTEQLHNQIRRLVSQINEQGGVIGRRLAVSRIDDGCGSDQAAPQAEKLAGLGILFVIGHFCPGVSQAVSQSYEEHGIVHVSLAPEPESEEIQDIGATTFFLPSSYGDREGEVAGQMLAERFGASRIAVLYEPNPAFEGLARQMKFALNRGSVREALFRPVANDDDLLPVVQELREARVEVIYFAGRTSVASLIMNVARSEDYHPHLVASQELANGAFGSMAPEAGNGTLMTVANPEFTASDDPLDPYRVHLAFQVWAEAVTFAQTTESEPVVSALSGRLDSNYPWSDNFPAFNYPEGSNEPYLWHVWVDKTHTPLVLRPMALIVGVGEFQNFADLAPPTADIALMRTFLRDELGFVEDDIITLSDRDAQRRDVNAAMRLLTTYTGRDDRVVIYFSTRGSQIADASGDESDGMDETLVLYDSANDGSDANHLSNDTFDVMLDRLGGRDVTVILDTDHYVAGSNTGANEMARRNQPIYLESAPGRRIWSAAAHHQHRASGTEGSLFTELFVAGAGTAKLADRNGDLIVSNEEQLAYLRSETATWCERQGGCGDGGLSPWLEAPPEDFARALVPPFAEITDPVPSTAMPDVSSLAPENVWGLMVGIDVYANLDNIQGAVADARDIHSALLDVGVPSENLILIEDANATRQAILDAWARLSSAAQPGDSIVFSYAGHGLQIEEAQAGNEADGKDEAIALTGYMSGATTGDILVDAEFREMFAAVPDVRVIFIADTEWSGNLTDVGEGTNQAALANVLYMAAVEDGTSMSVYMVGEEPRGALSWAFARAMRNGIDTDRNLQIDSRELELAVLDGVRELSQNSQNPVFTPPGRRFDVILPAPGYMRLSEMPTLEEPLKLYVMGHMGVDTPLSQLRNVELADMDAADLIVDMRSGEVIAGNDFTTRIDPLMPAAQLQAIIDRWLLLRDLEKRAAPDSLELSLRSRQNNYDQGARLDVILAGTLTTNLTLLHLDGDGNVRLLTDQRGNAQTTFEIPATDAATSSISVHLPADAPPGVSHLLALTSSAALGPFDEIPLSSHGATFASELLARLHTVAAPAAYQFASLRIAIDPLVRPPSGGKIGEAEYVTEGLVFQFGHTSAVNAVAVSPDLRFAISGGADDRINIWNIEQHLLVASIEAGLGGVNTVAFTPDGRHIIGAGELDEVKVWDFDTARLLYSFTGHEGNIQDLAVSQDGRRLLAAGSGAVATLWSFETGEVVQQFEGHSDWIRGVDFSPDGQQIVTASDDNLVFVWDVASGQKLREYAGHSNWVLDVAFSPDGNRVLSASADQTVRLWDADTTEDIAEFTNYTDWVRSVSFSPDGKYALSADDNNFVKIWNIDSGELETIFKGHTYWVYAAQYSSDGTMVISGGGDQSIRLWDVAAQAPVHAFEGLSAAVTVTAFSYDGTRTIAGAADGSLTVWNVNRGQLERTVSGQRAAITAIAAMPDGRGVLVGSDSFIDLIDMTSGEQLQRFEGHVGTILALAVAPDGGSFASASSDHALRVWDVASGNMRTPLEGHSDWVRGITYSPDGRFLFSAADDKEILQWDLDSTSDKPMQYFSGHTNWVRAVAVSPDGRFLASGGDDGTIIVRDISSGELTLTIKDAGNSSLGLFYTSDGGFLFSGDGVILNRWELAEGTRVSSYDISDGSATDFATTADGSTLAIAGKSGLILWETQTPRLLGTLIALTEADYLVRLDDGRWSGSQGAIANYVVWFEGFNPLSTPAIEHPSYYGPPDSIELVAQ